MATKTLISFTIKGLVEVDDGYLGLYANDGDVIHEYVIDNVFAETEHGTVVNYNITDIEYVDSY